MDSSFLVGAWVGWLLPAPPFSLPRIGASPNRCSVSSVPVARALPRRRGALRRTANGVAARLDGALVERQDEPRPQVRGERDVAPQDATHPLVAHAQRPRNIPLREV